MRFQDSELQMTKLTVLQLARALEVDSHCILPNALRMKILRKKKGILLHVPPHDQNSRAVKRVGQ